MNWSIIGVIASTAALIITLIGLGWEFHEWPHDVAKKLDNIDESTDTIEASITEVDLKDMEEVLHQMAGNFFSSSNSVETKLEESEIGVIVSLANRNDYSTVDFSFEKSINTKAINEKLKSDEELSKREKELFGQEPKVRSFSPKRIRYKIPSDDIEKIVNWIPSLLEKMDKFHTQFSKDEKEFDKKVEKRLKES